MFVKANHFFVSLERESLEFTSVGFADGRVGIRCAAAVRYRRNSLSKIREIIIRVFERRHGRPEE